MTNRAYDKKTRGVAALTMAAVFFGATMAYAPAAHAEEVSPNAKGIIGGALLGGELVCVTEALIGIRSPTAYIVGGGLGAVAGGLAGFGLEKGAAKGSASVVLLAGGIALVIPALVITLNATSFQGDPNAREDRAPTNSPPANPGSVGGTPVVGVQPAPAPAAPAGGGGAPATPAPAAAAPAPVAPPTSLISLSPSTLRVGMPVPQAHDAFSAQERRQLGMAQVTELRLSVVNVTF